MGESRTSLYLIRDIALRLLVKPASSASNPLVRQFRAERKEAVYRQCSQLRRRQNVEVFLFTIFDPRI
jgi:hypothetical protein